MGVTDDRHLLGTLGAIEVASGVNDQSTPFCRVRVVGTVRAGIEKPVVLIGQLDPEHVRDMALSWLAAAEAASHPLTANALPGQPAAPSALVTVALIGRPCIVCGTRTSGGPRCPSHANRGHLLPRSCARCGAAGVVEGNYCERCEPAVEAERQSRHPYRIGYSDPLYYKNRAKTLRAAGGRYGVCELCGGRGTKDDPLEVDHIVPLSARRPNPNALSNLRAVHHSENQARRRRRGRKGNR